MSDHPSYTSRTPHHARVADFMLRAKQAVPLFPIIPSAEVRKLRAKLILEEALETVRGLGFAVHMKGDREIEGEVFHPTTDDLDFLDVFEPDLVEIVDGCADISVVTTGTLIACGVPDEPVLEMVDYNNLMKFGPGHSYREDGKLIKPPGHMRPAFDVLLGDLGYRA